MDFSLTGVDGESMYLYDSGNESRVQMVFVPGVFSGEVWRYQLNYFSEDYRVLTFHPTVSNRGFDGFRSSLKKILDQEGMDNVVLVGANYSNSLVQSFEARENVSATVLVGAKMKLKKKLPRNIYRVFSSELFPCKLAKKLFMPSLKYRSVKEFCKSVELIDSSSFNGFQKRFGVRQPEKPCMIVHGDEDYFSDEDYARSLMSSASVMQLKAGVFSFYEKPQEFNKMLHDFLLKMDRKALKEEIEDNQEKNKSLVEFEDNNLAKVDNRL